MTSEMLNLFLNISTTVVLLITNGIINLPITNKIK
jgi:hypothetical protein